MIEELDPACQEAQAQASDDTATLLIKKNHITAAFGLFNKTKKI